jgi:hypothetical protein
MIIKGALRWGKGALRWGKGAGCVKKPTLRRPTRKTQKTQKTKWCSRKGTGIFLTAAAAIVVEVGLGRREVGTAEGRGLFGQRSRREEARG